MLANWTARIAGAVLLLAIASPATAQDVKLRAVTFLPSSNGTSKELVRFAKEVNEKSKGSIKIDVIGGPEAIPGREQGNAVRSGVVDMVITVPSRTQKLVPISDYFVASDLTPMEMRENGALEIANKQFEKRMNAHLLANIYQPIQSTVWLGKLSDKQLEKVRQGDFAGLRIRSNATYDPFFKKLGIEGLSISPADLFTAMERGTINGFGWATTDMVPTWGEVVKYRVTPDFNHNTAIVLMNLNKWRSLSDAQRTLLTRAAAEWEAASHERGKELVAHEKILQKKAGIEVIALQGEKGAEYLKTASDATWDSLKKRMPEIYEQVRALEPKSK
jgi:TRAP-type C4-dicarboxylate transport system substrate-binding protein